MPPSPTAASVVGVTDTVIWFRRDLRVRDHPALLAALGEARRSGGSVLALFVLDGALLGPAGAPRTAWLFRSLRALSASLDGALVVRRGDPAGVVESQLKRHHGAEPYAAHGG